MDATPAVVVAVELGRGKAPKVREDEDAVGEALEVQRTGSNKKRAASRKPSGRTKDKTPRGVDGRPQRILPSITVMTLGVI